jgi:ABC-type sugar transport system ATPase subunit
VRQVAEILQITPLLERKPGALSGGQRQRVAIGRAIVRNPKVFLFDEPLSSLDADLRNSMRLEIARLHRRLRATTIYVTHDQREAMTLADRIVVLQCGQIEQVGRPLELYESPVNAFVAGFIGLPKMNFLSGTVVPAPGGRRIRYLNDRLLEVARLPAGLEVGAGVKIGIRPEHFDSCAGSPVTFPVRLEVVERLGSASYAHVTAPSGEAMVVALRGGRDLTSGHELNVSVPSERIYLFSATGARLDRYTDRECAAQKTG